MRVAFNANFGQMDHSDITTVLVHHIAPLPRHLQTSTPSILSWICHWFFGNEIAVINDDRNFGEQHEFSQGNSHRRQWSTGTCNRSGHFAFRKDEAAARFVRDDGTDILVLDCCAPAEATAMRMGNEDCWSNLVEKRRDRADHHITIKWACGWSHLTEVLV